MDVIARDPPRAIVQWASGVWLALVIGASGYASLFWLTVEPEPSSQAIEQAAQQLRSQYQAGDLIFIVPSYATRARVFLGDLHPLAVKDPLREDFDAHPRAWVFGTFHAAEALRDRMKAAGFERTETQSADGVTVDLYTTNARFEVTYDFVDRLKQAKVWHEKGDQRIPCNRWTSDDGQGGKGGRWMCPHDSDWFYVAPQYHRMGDHIRRCLWAHPPNEGRLVISYPRVPLTGWLYGRGGHTLNGALNARADVFLDVATGMNVPQRYAFGLNEYFRPFWLETATTTTATVTFAVSSPDAGANHFCFRADVRRSRNP